MGKNPAQKAKEQAAKAADAVVSSRKTKEKKTTKKKVVAKEAAERGCKIAKCKREYRAKGYCRVHYKKWRRGEYGLARYKTCGSMDCKKPMVVNHFGLCEDHFQSQFVRGEAAPKAAAPAPAEKPAAEKTTAA